MTKTDMDFIKQVGKLKQTTDNENINKYLRFLYVVTVSLENTVI